jgi:16S rRNA (guanine966-N2)-methyltransferase
VTAILRIISGKYKSRTIFSSQHKTLRPTSDRTRETLFNILTHRVTIQSTACLDLFAGTGALGFEALSRGASTCDFVDVSRKSSKLIEKTASSLGCLNQVRFIKSEAIDFLREHPRKYDIIFADPPYDFNQYKELIALSLANAACTFALEHSVPIEQATQISNLRYGFNLISKTIGKTSLEIFLYKRS